MPLSNAEKQRRWRERNQVVLTGDAREIAEQLIGMDDQKKLRKVAAFINDHLRHPERTSEERDIALGRVQISSLNGPLSKTAALAKLKAPDPVGSWRVEATTKDGKYWINGVRLATKEEAEAYKTHHVPYDLKDAGAIGYVTGKILHGDDPPNCSITRKRKGGRTYLEFDHGDCVLLEWRPCAGAR